MKFFFKYFLFFICIFFIFYILSNLSNWLNPDGVEVDLDEIRAERELVLTKIDTLRGSTPDLFIFTELKNGEIYKMYLGTIDMSLYRFLKEGDYLLKKSNENTCIVIRDGKTNIFSFIRIPYKSRLNKEFPLEWRCKWLKSSEWDSLSIYKDSLFQICM